MLYVKIKHWFKNDYTVHYKFNWWSLWRRYDLWYCPEPWHNEAPKMFKVPHIFTYDRAVKAAESLTPEKIQRERVETKEIARAKLNRIISDIRSYLHESYLIRTSLEVVPEACPA